MITQQCKLHKLGNLQGDQVCQMDLAVRLFQVVPKIKDDQ